ncbi:hypothetical protein SLEP1_g30830 [Rubroshorea leprosula]|uniref:Reticulon-like protein n=1 Tax=Rubroshorea leprosula TaxID=152421 RepID=A0AAV5K1F4_9ROSI|nr:hypothetical protein SLEP1_g30830 [Rubroshorea leprosula]
MVDSVVDGDVTDSDFLSKANENESSSSDSDIDRYASLRCATKKRLFGRDMPLYVVLGGGQPADIMLWRNKQISLGIFAGATVIWLLFEWIEYHLLTFLCHFLILSLAALFLWSSLVSFLNMAPPELPKVLLPEQVFVTVALVARNEFNRASRTFQDVASGKDLKKCLSMVAALWIVSVIGSWFSLLTLLYLAFVMLLTVPVLYEKHEDTVDAYARKGLVELKKQYAILDEKLLRKIPIPNSLLHKKQQ